MAAKSFSKLQNSSVSRKMANLGRQCRHMMAKRLKGFTAELIDSGFWILEVYILCGI